MRASSSNSSKRAGETVRLEVAWRRRGATGTWWLLGRALEKATAARARRKRIAPFIRRVYMSRCEGDVEKSLLSPDVTGCGFVAEAHAQSQPGATVTRTNLDETREAIACQQRCNRVVIQAAFIRAMPWPRVQCALVM